MTEQPTGVDLSASEATKLLTGGEIIAIEDRFHSPIDALSGVKQLVGLVWAYRRRNENEGRKASLVWADVEKMSLQDLSDYFADEPDSLDEDAEGNDDAA